MLPLYLTLCNSASFSMFHVYRPVTIEINAETGGHKYAIKRRSTYIAAATIACHNKHIKCRPTYTGKLVFGEHK